MKLTLQVSVLLLWLNLSCGAKRFQGFSWDADEFKGSKPGFDWDTGDKVVFEDDIVVPSSERTTTVAIPGMETPRTPCEDRCQTTPEYNPVCADNGLTYFSYQRLKCAQLCGRRLRMVHIGACAPLV